MAGVRHERYTLRAHEQPPPIGGTGPPSASSAYHPIAVPESTDALEDLIAVMPEALANKIAAGEVVQRPASAAKELLENAIDAGGDQIALIVKSAGSDLIQVVDNGCGMSAKDAVFAFRRHATSKIRSVDDLERIRTLGFRGEALASISAVAQVELKTKRVGDAHATSTRVDGGSFVGQLPCAAPDGTSISVRNLFYNVPARRNFLKSPATEFKHLVETFQFLALSNPAVGFRLVHDETEIYHLTPARQSEFTDRLRQRVSELWDRSLADNVVPVDEKTSYVNVRGVIGSPALHRRNRNEQFLFVNGRYVKSRYLEHAVASAYEASLQADSYPFFVLFIDLDPRHVDVNVHPAKAEVKFDDERGIYGMLKAVIRKAIGTAHIAPRFDPDASSEDGAPIPVSFSASGTLPDGGFGPQGWAPRRADAPGEEGVYGRSFQPIQPRPDLFGSRPAGDWADVLYGGSARVPEASTIPSGTMSTDSAEQGAGRGNDLLWQLHERYILTQIHSGLMFFDQNAAHQRILYEKALRTMQSGFGLSQQLLFPHTLDFGPADIELLRELQADFRALGFDIDFFSGRSVVVRGVPADVRAGNERSILQDIIEQYKTNREQLEVSSRENLARSVARRSAITPGTRLSVDEMRALIDQLFECDMPYVCPVGRPTLIKITTDELAQRFAG